MFKYIDGDFQQGTTTENSGGKLYILDGGRSESKLEITKNSLQDIEQLTEENRQKWLAKAGWGLAGALAFGPIGVAAGLFLGGKGKKYSVVCTLSDGRSFMAEVSDDIYKKLVAIKRFSKNLTTNVQQATTNDAETEKPVPASPEALPENCPRCNNKLPPPFQSSGRIVCGKCGWRNKPKKS